MSPVLPATEEVVTTETTPESNGTPAVVKPKARKKAAKKPAAKKNAKVTKVPAKKSGPSLRERVFKLLAGRDSTGAEIATKLELTGIPMLLKDEGVCKEPRIRRLEIEGVRGVTYQLTALGKKHHEQGKVDEHAAPSSAGKKWPSGK